MSENAKISLDKAVSAYLDLETGIRNLSFMAGIAASLMYEELDGKSDIDDGYRLIRITPKKHERLLYAVQNTADMAEELDKTYHKLWEDARDAA